jgi:hypothetical protein
VVGATSMSVGKMTAFREAEAASRSVGAASWSSWAACRVVEAASSQGSFQVGWGDAPMWVGAASRWVGAASRWVGAASRVVGWLLQGSRGTVSGGFGSFR